MVVLGMALRFIGSQDVQRLKELEDGYEWTYQPDFLFGIAVVDEHDRPVMAAAAWKRAEVHVVTDHQWDSPQAREAAFLELHGAMERVLAKEGVAEAVTWMDGMKAFGRRLKRLGWDVAKRTMWAKRIF